MKNMFALVKKLMYNIYVRLKKRNLLKPIVLWKNNFMHPDAVILYDGRERKPLE